MKDKQWTISTDEENYNYDLFETKEEAIKAFRADVENGGYDEVKASGYFWVGQVSEPSAMEFFDVDGIIENAQERACDDCSEWAENWLTDISSEQKEELQGLIAGWAERHGLKPNFYRIENSEKITLGKESI